VEDGAFTRYFIIPRLTARVGHEFWWIHDVALALRQIGTVISQNAVRHLDGTAEIIVYGGSAAIEYVWVAKNKSLPHLPLNFTMLNFTVTMPGLVNNV
jgi:hypothetical protein